MPDGRDLAFAALILHLLGCFAEKEVDLRGIGESSVVSPGDGGDVVERIANDMNQTKRNPDQISQLAARMKSGRDERPDGVLTAMLLIEEDKTRLIAVWTDQDRLDRYLATAPVPRGTELFRAVGAEPTFKVAPVAELG